MVECEDCGDLCGEPPKVSPFSGAKLCAECHYDEGIQAEDRFLEELDDEERDPVNGQLVSATLGGQDGA